MRQRKKHSGTSLLLCVMVTRQSCLASLFSAQTTAAAATPASGPIEDIGWPRQVRNDKETLIYYQL
jgi:hypothetical protein